MRPSKEPVIVSGPKGGEGPQPISGTHTIRR